MAAESPRQDSGSRSGAGQSDPSDGAKVPRKKRRQSVTLSLDDIVQATLHYIAEHGLDALSIRGIAGDVGLSPMSIYKYVDSKEDLLDLALLQVLSRMEIPAAYEPNWEDRVVTIMAAWRRLLLTHAELIPVLLIRPIPYRSVGLARLQEAILTNLESAGITGSAAVRAFWQIFTLTTGHVMFDAPRRRWREEDMRVYADALRDIGETRSLTHVATLAEELASLQGRGAFEDTLRALLAGVVSASSASGAAPSSSAEA